MKTKLLTIAIAAPVLFSAVAFATPAITGSTSSANVNLSVDDDGIATLYGNIDSVIEKTLIENEVKALDGVEDVRNLLFVSE